MAEDAGAGRIGRRAWALLRGYLMLAGEKGLATIEKTRLADRQVSDGEVYAAIQAIQYYWTYGNGKIAPTILQRAMRLLLDRPTLSDTAITTLSRWKDWSVQSRLMQLYGTKDYDEKSTKKAIISYMIASTKDGRVLERIDGLSNATAVTVDSSGAIYVGEVNGTNVKKFVKK